MKHLGSSICLGAFCAGTVLVEYEILLHLDAVLVVFAAASALAVGFRRTLSRARGL
jgi:hypothetical protein